jgi:hypothetical protein
MSNTDHNKPKMQVELISAAVMFTWSFLHIRMVMVHQ